MHVECQLCHVYVQGHRKGWVQGKISTMREGIGPRASNRTVHCVLQKLLTRAQLLGAADGQLPHLLQDSLDLVYDQPWLVDTRYP